MKNFLNISGKAVVYIDWANVFGWQESLKRRIEIDKLYKAVNQYKQVKVVKFFFGADDNPESKKFLDTAEEVGYKVISKPVKHVIVGWTGKGKNREPITTRKCDFDIEVTMGVYDDIARNVETFIFFSGDGDFAPLYKMLVKKNKQVIVVYQKGHLGKEISVIKKGIYRTEFENFGV